MTNIFFFKELRKLCFGKGKGHGWTEVTWTADHYSFRQQEK